jgi:hypothetical protein
MPRGELRLTLAEEKALLAEDRTGWERVTARNLWFQKYAVKVVL